MATYYKWSKSNIVYKAMQKSNSSASNFPRRRYLYVTNTQPTFDSSSGVYRVTGGTEYDATTTSTTITISAGQYVCTYNISKSYSTDQYFSGTDRIMASTSGSIFMLNNVFGWLHYIEKEYVEAGYVYSINQSAYPNGGESGGYYYSGRTTVKSPTAPSNISYVTSIQTRNVNVSWGASTSNTSYPVRNYLVLWSINGGGYQQAYSTTGTSFSASLPSNTASVQFRVYATDTNNQTGDTTTGTLATVSLPLITVPEIAMSGQEIPISWEPINGADSYVLQRKTNNGSWEQVYSGNETQYTDTAGEYNTVQYSVYAIFSDFPGVASDSIVITVVSSSTLAISGSDEDLGYITNDIPYSVVSNTGNQINLQRAVNSVTVAELKVDSGFAYNIPVLDLPTGTNTITITATVQSSSGPVTLTRTWTYTKETPSFQSSGSVATLSQNGQYIFPQTLAEAVKAIGGPWGGNLSTALDKLALAALFNREVTPKYTEVKVDLSKVQPGDIVNLPVNGVMVPHVVVQVGNPGPEMYDSSCDGVWLLRQDIAENGQWNSSSVNTLDGSTIMTNMQGYVDDYDSTVQAAIKTVKIPYCVGGGDATIKTLSDGLECKMFPLSGYEVGFTTSNNPKLPVDGAVLSYFQGTSSSADNKRIAYLNGVAANWWLRSSSTDNTTAAWGVGTSGSYYFWLVNNTYGYRPCFTLPTTFTATYYVDESGNVYPSQEYTTAGDFYDLWGNVIPSVKIATGSYTGTGTYGADNPNTLTFPFEPKFLVVQSNSGSGNNYYILIWNFNAKYPMCFSKYSTFYSANVTFTQDSNSVSWYASSAAEQLNAITLYYYIAIG